MVKKLLISNFTILITLLLITTAYPNKIYAETIIFEDNFNDNILNSHWWRYNFANGDSGSYSPVNESLIIQENNNHLNYIGYGSTGGYFIQRYVGWVGNSIVIINSEDTENIIIETEINFETLNAGTTGGITLEFDKNNRIVFNIGIEKPYRKYMNITLEEKGNIRVIRCASETCYRDWTGVEGDTIKLRLLYDSNTKELKANTEESIMKGAFYGTDGNNKRIGLIGTVWGTDSFINLSYDNFKVSTENLSTNSVPDLKQYDPEWGGNEYDFASRWYPNDPSMSRWACALTSANMVMQYHGIGEVNPDDLNDWLKQQPDGFSRSGGVMWNTIGKYSKSKGQNSKTVEFQYLTVEPTEENIRSEIESGNPPILKLANKFGGNHFIVAAEIKGDEIKVNDPGNKDNKTLADATEYWGEVLQMGRYTLSSTDLSYIVGYVNEGFETRLNDSDDELLANSFSEDSIVDAKNDHTETLGENLEALYYPKPETGAYNIIIDGDGIFQLDTYLYDQTGDSAQAIHKGFVFEDHPETFVIHYDKEDNNNSYIVDPVVTFGTLQEDLTALYDNNKIKNRGLFRSSYQLIKNAQKSYDRDKVLTAKILLDVAKQRILLTGSQYFDPDYMDIYLEDLNSLYLSL